MRGGLYSIILVGVLIITALTSRAQADSIAVNASVVDSISPQEESIEFSEPVTYYGKDSTVMDLVNSTVYLYGPESYVKYGDLQVTAAFIRFSFEENTAFARGMADSTGQATIGRPLFKEGANEFTEDSLGYNFKTKKGISYGARTQEGEAYLIAGVSKKQDNNWIHMAQGMFTTCDKEKPHYHFRLTKAIVIPNEKVVSGPLYMKVGKVPTPLALPFGFFPNKKESTHGLLLPGYGNAGDRGFFLKELGYYIPFNQHLETKLLFDIYTRGSWSVQSWTNYKKRYKYDGSFRLTRTVNKLGLQELPSYFQQETFNIYWNHRQDNKARPNTTFSASVNMGSSQNFRNNLNSTQQDFLTSTFNSAVQYGKTFPGKPYSLALSANHTQNVQTRQVQMTLPSATVNLSRINLLEKIFPKAPIGINGVMAVENYINTKEQDLQIARLEQLMRKAQTGARFSSTASTSWKLGPYLTLNPSANYSGVMTFKHVAPIFDEDLGYEKLDTVQGVRYGGNWNASLTANTRLYGTYTFGKSKTLKAIRHMVQPSAGLSYTPYTNFVRYGYYDDEGNRVGYTEFQAGRFSPSSSIEAASINLGLNQNIEAKIRDKSSAKVAYKKVKIIEGWNMRMSNNLLRDSLNWSNLNMSAFTTIAKNVTLNYTSTYSLYDRDTLGREVNETMWRSQGKLLRQEGTTLALSFNFSGGNKTGDNEDGQAQTPIASQQNLQSTSTNNIDFTIPWNLRMDYNLGLDRVFDRSKQADTLRITHTIAFAGDFRIFAKWHVNFLTNYDIATGKVTTSNFGLHWDLHCWELSANYVPFGERKSYFVQLNIKSAMLQDVKIQKRGNYTQKLI